MEPIHSLKIGDVQLDNNVILAPMAGVTDLPFRTLCARSGAGMTCTEMVSAKAIYYNNKKTYELLKLSEEEPIISVQLFGHEPELMADMATRIEEEINYDILDINMGCPVPKVVNNEEGSALMKNPLLAGRIVEETVSKTNRPVTVKIRIGFDDEHINAVEMAHVLEESGASAIAVHGRTREQYYSGEANWDVIADVKAHTTIPIIGNGDLTCFSDICEMYNQTKVDGYMIGRAARGNPWIFEGVLREAEEVSDKSDMVTNGNDYKPTWSSIKEMILTHAKMLVDYKGEYIGIREMRKHTAWYTAGFPHSATFRGKVNEVESLEELAELLGSI